MFYSAKNRMLSVQRGQRTKSDEELGTVAIGARVRHGKDTGTSVLQRGVKLVINAQRISNCATHHIKL